MALSNIDKDRGRLQDQGHHAGCETMKDVPAELLQEFLQTCHTAAERRLVRCSSGNLSRRLTGDRMLAKGTRSWMDRISAQQVSLCRISDGALLDGPNATVEIGFHAGILKTRPDVNVVLHFQSPFATVLACQDTGDMDYFVLPEIPFYIGRVRRVPYLLPGSKELAAAVTEAMQDHDMVVMSNHGLVTAAADCAHAIQNAEFFELACQVIVQCGSNVKPLNAKDAETLLAVRQSTVKGI